MYSYLSKHRRSVIVVFQFSGISTHNKGQQISGPDSLNG